MKKLLVCLCLLIVLPSTCVLAEGEWVDGYISEMGEDILGDIAFVTDCNGDCYFSSGEEWLLLTKNMTLSHGATIKTDAAANVVILFNGELSLNVCESSEILLDYSAENELRFALVSGDVWINARGVSIGCRVCTAVMHAEFSDAVVALSTDDEKTVAYPLAGELTAVASTSGINERFVPCNLCAVDLQGAMAGMEFEPGEVCSRLGIPPELVMLPSTVNSSLIWIIVVAAVIVLLALYVWFGLPFGKRKRVR